VRERETELILSACTLAEFGLEEQKVLFLSLYICATGVRLVSLSLSLSYKLSLSLSLSRSRSRSHALSLSEHVLSGRTLSELRLEEQKVLVQGALSLSLSFSLSLYIYTHTHTLYIHI
jgi:hypothetical protein